MEAEVKFEYSGDDRKISMDEGDIHLGRRFEVLHGLPGPPDVSLSDCCMSGNSKQDSEIEEWKFLLAAPLMYSSMLGGVNIAVERKRRPQDISGGANIVVTEVRVLFQGPAAIESSPTPQQPPHPAPYLADTKSTEQRPCLEGAITEQPPYNVRSDAPTLLG